MQIVNNKLMRMFEAAAEFVCVKGAEAWNYAKAFSVVEGNPSAVRAVVKNWLGKVVAFVNLGASSDPKHVQEKSLEHGNLMLGLG